MAENNKVPEVVKEYLIHRGFSGTYKALETDLKNEKDKAFRIDKIVEHLHFCITSIDLTNLREFWSFLDGRIFSRLQFPYTGSVKKLENGIMKMYLVQCVQSSKQDKVQEFFEKIGPDLQGQVEWKEWFMLPFCRNPEEHNVFSMYFTKQWQDTFFLSLHNLLSVVMQSIPVPSSMSHDEDVRKIKRLQEENKQLRQQIANLRQSKEPLNIPPADITVSDNLLSPTGTLPGPSAMDLMDDFYIISQETVVEDSKSPPTQRSQPIKAILKNIGRSVSPAPENRRQLDDKKNTGPVNAAKSPQQPTVQQTGKVVTTVKQQDAQYSRSKSEPGSTVIAKAQKPKSGIPAAAASSANGTTSSQGKQSRTKSLDTPASQPNTGLLRAKERGSSAIPTKLKKPELCTGTKESKRSSQGEVSVFREKNHISNSSVGDSRQTDNDSVNSTKSQTPQLTGTCPFLLLSQEEYSEHRSPVIHCKFSSTHHSVATLDSDGVVKVWSLQPAPVTLATVMSKSTLLSIEWASKTDKYILLGSKAGSVRLFDVSNKKIEKEASVDQTYHRVNWLSCNPQGTEFVCCSSGRPRAVDSTHTITRAGMLTLWNLERMQCQRSLALGQVQTTVNCSCYNSQGLILLTGSADGWIRVYALEADSDACIGSWSAHSGEVYTVCFSVDERSCFSMGGDGKLIEWSLSKYGEKLNDLAIHVGSSGPFVRSEPGGFKQVQTPKGKLFALDSEGSHLITCNQNRGLLYEFIKPKNVQPVMYIGGHKTPVITLDWVSSHDTKTCLTGSMDGKVRVSTLLKQ